MTLDRLIKEYTEVFKTTIEEVGKEVGNPTYRNVRKILDEDESLRILGNMTQDEVPFHAVISTLGAILMCRQYGSENLYKSEILQGLINDLWERYLKGPSNKFFRRNGLPVIEKLDNESIIVLRKL